MEGHLSFLSWDERMHVCTPLLGSRGEHRFRCTDSAPGSTQWVQAPAVHYTPFLLHSFSPPPPADLRVKLSTPHGFLSELLVVVTCE